MKVVWIVNIPIGPLAKSLNVTASSGSWLTAALDEVKDPTIQLHVITTCNIKQDIVITEEGVTYIGLALGSTATYKHSNKNLARWQKILSDITPDILQIWGTEYQHALSAILAKPTDCKAFVYVQGVLESVYNHYFGGLDKHTLSANTSPVERISGKTIFQARKNIKRSAENEKQIVTRADGIILETKWSEDYYRLACGCEVFYHHALSINKAFLNAERAKEDVERHTVFTSASDYPLKGVHQLIKALALVKKQYPTVKLYVPGYKIERNLGWKQKLKTKAYRRYLNKLITSLDLWNNIIFTGPLSAEHMAERMKKANVFVCCSAIENHSSTLREAMHVGVPCISTCVGGVPEVLQNGYNGELYDFADSAALAGRLIALFENEEYADLLAERAKKTICDYYSNHTATLKDIYIQIKQTL